MYWLSVPRSLQSLWARSRLAGHPPGRGFSIVTAPLQTSAHRHCKIVHIALSVLLIPGNRYRNVGELVKKFGAFEHGKEETPRSPQDVGVGGRRSVLQRMVRRALEALAPATASTLTAPLAEPLEPRVLLSGDGFAPRVDGRIDVPGEVDRYTFTLNSDVRLVFDSLTNDSQIQWSLDGPLGSVVGPTALNGSDASDRSGAPAVPLSAGTYTLNVDGVGDRTGDYAFRLLNLSNVPTVTPGVPVSGRLDPANASAAYQFEAVAGQSYYFDRTQSPASTTTWRLIGPDGRDAFALTNLSTDVDTITLQQTGTYTLLIEGRVSAGTAAVDFGFTVYPAAPVQRVLELGQAQRSEPRWGGGSLGLDATRWVEAGALASLNAPQAVTMEATVTVESFANTWMPVFYKGAGDATYEASRTFSLWINSNGSVLLSTSDGPGAGRGEQPLSTASGVVQLGVATHIAATIDRDSGLARIFINGEQRAERTVRTNTPYASSAPLQIGHTDEPSSSYSNLHGRIDEVRVWTVARSAAQIAAARGTPLAGNESGLVLNYLLGETAGTVVGDYRVIAVSGRVVSLYDALPDVIEGRIATPGQRVEYTLDLASTRRVVFDALSDVNFTWSL
ncbi:MAG: LamG domain-containing protein, partial [Proteobacteria bacterium]|nr:LamG domain-containing protein [Pseudomonadota bacterium]